MFRINWQQNRPAFPSVGDTYYDVNISGEMMYDGTNWVQLSVGSTMSPEISLIPSEEDLEKHPSLKEAWENFLIVKKLLGV
jgi:hypothetical protein